MLLSLGIFLLALGWLLVYSGYAGISVTDEVKHIFNPSSYAAPKRKNPAA